MNEKYTLQFPFTSAAGERIDVLPLRRLKVKDMRAARRASDKPEEWDEPLMAAMTGLVAEDLAEMDLLDYQALQKRFQAMLSMATEPAAAVAGNGAAGEVVSLSAQ
ncbi:phage tail assembly protein [Salmonella enterica subsp. enterica serovar Abony]|nr:phage tail assembly protein [Salmonella enterica subsp. enterica serovar Ndolo]EBX9481238.1 phage tail assembly protein [Salmonella enterica subsp. enterica serovar Abony]EDH1235554.1 phage tail assembly protein [Salmonella enterica subsp. enterica]MKM00601.1 phage tail assembly protein [Salmonella enterica subsp. enterica serovar Isaszeg]HBD1788824.1 phage tail assembly protein [Salmonella enterica]